MDNAASKGLSNTLSRLPPTSETPTESTPRSEETPTALLRGTSDSLRGMQMESTDVSLRRTNSGKSIGRSTKARFNQTGSMTRQELPICYDFVQGKCRRLNCRYLHDFGAVIRHNAKESRICFDHLRGECTRGSLCRFSHDIPNGICYDFCRGACPRRGKCPWTHNLIEIAWNTAKQPLPDSQRIDICRKVLNVIKTSCQPDIAEPAIYRLVTQPSLQMKILSLNLIDEPSPLAHSHAFGTSTTSPDSFSNQHPAFIPGVQYHVGNPVAAYATTQEMLARKAYRFPFQTL